MSPSFPKHKAHDLIKYCKLSTPLESHPWKNAHKNHDVEIFKTPSYFLL